MNNKLNKAILLDSPDTKSLRSKVVNWDFNKKTGVMATWGKTVDDDPEYSPFGPTIADIEITTVCEGPNGIPCSFCYKGNTKRGTNMSLDLFKKIFNKLPDTLTQIAFGADASLQANPDTFDIFRHCKDNGVIPNVTVANISESTAKKLTELCGAVAVSRYENPDWCYDSVKKLHDAGHEQVNIHQLLSKETYYEALQTIKDVASDPRLSKLKAVVFLSLKPKKRGEKFTRLSQDKFNKVVETAEKYGISYGFDSCGSNKFVNGLSDTDKDKYIDSVEPCESSCFSMYIDVHGKYFPCSFTPGIVNDGVGDWNQGIDILNSWSFMEDVWNTPKVTKFRDTLINNKDKNGLRKCPLYWI